MVDQVFVGTQPAGWAKEQLAADHLPRNSGHITAGEVGRVSNLIDCVAAMEREYRDALDYGDGNMPDWVKHRYIPRQCLRCRCDTHAVSTCPDPKCPVVTPTPQRVDPIITRLVDEAVANLASYDEKPTPAFHALLDEIRAIHDAKNKDYADSADALRNFRDCEEWGLSADRGCFTRIGDKMMRLKNLMRREFLDEDGPAVRDESVEDTALDAAIYLMIFVLLRRERRAKEAK